MNDELELVRAPVAVGVAAGPVADHPAIDARAVVARPRRRHSPAATAATASSGPARRARRRHLARPATDRAGGRAATWLVAAVAAGSWRSLSSRP